MYMALDRFFMEYVKIDDGSEIPIEENNYPFREDNNILHAYEGRNTLQKLIPNILIESVPGDFDRIVPHVFPTSVGVVIAQYVLPPIISEFYTIGMAEITRGIILAGFLLYLLVMYTAYKAQQGENIILIAEDNLLKISSDQDDFEWIPYDKINDIEVGESDITVKSDAVNMILPRKLSLFREMHNTIFF